MDDAYADQVDNALAKATRQTTRAVEAGDATTLATALESTDDAEIIRQVNSASS